MSTPERAAEIVPAQSAPHLAMRRWAWVIVGLFLLGGIGYSLVVPPFETPDEPFHYAFARHIAQGNGLPVQNPDAPGPWAQEGSQAPLYYLLTGLATAPIDQGDFAELSVRNPRANIGDPLYPGNKNFMLYSGRWHPLQGANLALHVGRWLSLVLGALTLWWTFRLAAFAFPRSNTLPLLAMAFVAAIPQFIFLSASFSNDNAVITASTFVLFWLARWLVRPDDAPIRWWEWSVLGVALGLAALSKLQGLGLIPLSGLVVLYLAWRRRAWRMLFSAALFAGAPAILIAGWWYWRNIALYGDWSGLSHLMEINGRRQEAIDWGSFWPEFDGLRFSAWGIFGWFNILLPDWFYRVMDAVTLVGLIGAAAATIRSIRRRADASRQPAAPVLLMLWLWLAMMLALLLYWTAQATGSQGRLLFPAIAAFAVLLIAGIDFWLHRLPAIVRRMTWAALLLLLASMSIYALSWLLPGAYYAPAPVSALAATAKPVDIRIGNDGALRLVGVDIGSERVRAGEAVPVTLYLQAAEPLDQDYQLFLQLLDENGQELANLTSHPGWGRNPTTFWDAGATYADAYLLRVTGKVEEWAPVAARLYVGFIDPATEGTWDAPGDFLPLPAFDTGGREITPFVGAVVVEPAAAPAASGDPAGAEFGGVIRLDSASTALETGDAGSARLVVDLLWEALGTPATDYTAFVHVIDETGALVGGFDRTPAGERLPTHLWRAGDRIQSRMVIDFDEPLPAGAYEVWVGLYESDSGGALRLPVTAAGELESGDGQVKLRGPIVVE